VPPEAFFGFFRGNFMWFRTSEVSRLDSRAEDRRSIPTANKIKIAFSKKKKRKEVNILKIRAGGN